MLLVTSLVLTLVVVLASCENGEEVKQIQTRGAWRNNEPQSDIVWPNDFGIHNEPPPPEGGRYSSQGYHYHGPPPDNNGYHHMSIPAAVTGNSSLTSGIPLDFAKSISNYDVSDLLLNYIEDEPEDMYPKKQVISNRFGEVDDNETERNAAQFARPAKCLPELTTVRIAESKDPNIFYVPECTRIERCGGCCSHVLLSCQPVETEMVTFSVVKTEYTGNRKLKYVGKEPVPVEKHTKCKCGCKVKESDCNTYQEYRESECRCVCKNLDEEKKCYRNSFVKLWNPDICACQCREIEPCSTGFQFDHNECSCIASQFKRRYILTDFRKEQPDSVSKDD